jgi:hypothetical protein
MAGCSGSSGSAADSSSGAIDLASTDVFRSYLPHNARAISCAGTTCSATQVCCLSAAGDYCGAALGDYCGEGGNRWSDCAVDADCTTGLVCCPATVGSQTVHRCRVGPC